MDKQTNLYESVVRHTRDVMILFPQKARIWDAIPADDLDRLDDFVSEYFKDVSDILLDMVAECINIERKFKKTIDNCNK